MDYEEQATKLVDPLELEEPRRTEMIRDLAKVFSGIDSGIDRRQLERLLSCNFCGKRSDEVAKLVAGPAVYICNECIQLCVDILSEEGLIKFRDII